MSSANEFPALTIELQAVDVRSALSSIEVDNHFIESRAETQYRKFL